MSYSRFWDSDVYLYYHVNGYLTCACCWLTDNLKSLTFHSTNDIVSHLKEHEAAGHKVSPEVYEELWQDDYMNFSKNPRVLVLAAGRGSRWANHNNIRKHQIEIDNESLINRIYRQFSEYTNDITIVGLDETYKIEGAQLFIPHEAPEVWKDMAKFYSSEEKWSNERTILLFGDVYFTDEAVTKIMSNKDELAFFLRKEGSTKTGKRWKEIFAIAFDGSWNEPLREHIREIIDAGYATSAGGWMLYKKITNIYKNEELFRDGTPHVVIDDLTEDFDTPEDLETWLVWRDLVAPAS